MEIHEALEQIQKTLRRHTELLEQIMSAEDDLKAAIADNAQAITDATREIDALVTKLESGNVPAADVAGVINTLKTQTAQLRLAVSNAVNPASPPVTGTGGAAVPAPAAPPELKTVA